jgi:hypothetical protein
MKINIQILVLALIVLAPLAAYADGPRVLEDGREVEARMITLPSLADGTLAIQGCANCKRLTFEIAREARFYIGDIEVGFADLSRHLRSNSQVGVLVVSPKNQNVVTRIRASLPSTR